MMKHLKNLWNMRTSIRAGDNLQLLFAGGGRKVSGVPLNYSMTGHASVMPQCHLVKKRCLKISYTI